MNSCRMLSGSMMAQQVSLGHIQNRISRDKNGINVFDVKKDSVEYKGLSIDLGAAFNMDYQAINSSTTNL